jgi:hypothetical protein
MNAHASSGSLVFAYALTGWPAERDAPGLPLMLGTGSTSHSKAVLMTGHIRRLSLTDRQWMPILPVAKRLVPPVTSTAGRPAWMRSREAAASGDGAVTLIRWRIIQSMARVVASNTSGSCSWNSTLGSHCTWDAPWVQISVPMP